MWQTVTPTSTEVTAFRKLKHKEAVNDLLESASETVIIHSLYYTQVHHTAVIVKPKIYLAGSGVLTLLLLRVHVFWHAMLFCQVSGSRHFEQSRWLQNIRNHSLQAQLNPQYLTVPLICQMSWLYPDHHCIYKNVSLRVENNPTKLEVEDQFLKADLNLFLCECCQQNKHIDSCNSLLEPLLIEIKSVSKIWTAFCCIA